MPRKDKIMKDILNIAVVNFHAIWGSKEENLKKIIEFAEAAGKRGAEMIVFPETALSGYSDEEGKARNEKMHALAAETIPGPATDRVAEVASKYGMYVFFGMPEKDKNGVVYNSTAIIFPDGRVDSYRKLHLPFAEGNWAVHGDKPKLIDTPWGPVGFTICYDTYCFPEIMRYYRAKGARLNINCTACPDAPCTIGAAAMSVPAYAYINYMFIATANLVGDEDGTHFCGASCVVGPDITRGGAYTYLGKMFKTPDCDRQEMFLGTIDLSAADVNTDIPLFRMKPDTAEADWRPELYEWMAKDVMENR